MAQTRPTLILLTQLVMGVRLLDAKCEDTIGVAFFRQSAYRFLLYTKAETHFEMHSLDTYTHIQTHTYVHGHEHTHTHIQSHTQATLTRTHTQIPTHKQAHTLPVH